MYTRNPKANAKLTCFACQEDMKNENQTVADCDRQDWRATSARFTPPKGKHGLERRDRDDEEELSRIPILLSDDSDTWIDDIIDVELESEQEEETQSSPGLNLKQSFLKVEENSNEHKQGNQFWSPNPVSLAFLLGPRRRDRENEVRTTH